MKFGASMFFTDYSMGAAELAVALEQRGFDIVWAPEHSHIPVSRKTAFILGGELPKRYYDVMDPFVTLTAAAMATKKLKVGTGVCLVSQRDPIQTAKLVASIDQVSGGRFVFGVGNGWNRDEMENHGTDYATRHKRARENIEAMKEIWTKSKAEYHGEFVNFDPMMAWPKPVRVRIRRSSWAAPFRIRRAALCATATAGCRRLPTRARRRLSNSSRAFARCAPRPAAIPTGWTSRSAASSPTSIR